MIMDYQTKPNTLDRYSTICFGGWNNRENKAIAEMGGALLAALSDRDMTKRSQIHSVNAEQFFSRCEIAGTKPFEEHRGRSATGARGRPPALTWSSALLATTEARSAPDRPLPQRERS